MYNDNLVILGTIFLLYSQNVISTTQLLLLLALSSTENCSCSNSSQSTTTRTVS